MSVTGVNETSTVWPDAMIRALGDGGAMPAGALSVVTADVELAVDDHRPDPGRGPISGAVFSERGDVQVVG
jgi:hypothetical protein